MPLGERDRTGERVRVRNLKKVTPPLVTVATPDLSDKLKHTINGLRTKNTQQTTNANRGNNNLQKIRS